MSSQPRLDEYWTSPSVRVVGGAFCGVVVGLLAYYFFEPSRGANAPMDWFVIVYPAAGAVLLALFSAVFFSPNIRGVLKLAFAGMFLGTTGAMFLVTLGSNGAAFEAQVALRATVYFGVPSGALISGIVLLLLNPRRRERNQPDDEPKHAIADRCTRRQRRRWQFGLRGLLAFTAILSLCVWLSMPARQYYERQRAVARIVAAGGEVVFTGQYRQPKWFEIVLGGDYERRRYGAIGGIGFRGADEELDLLRHFPELIDLSIVGPLVSDAGLAVLAKLPRLESLSLDNNNISDSGLAHVSQLTQLKTLILDGKAITDAGIPQISRLPKLEVLMLNQTSVTDAGLKELRDLPQLRRLVIYSATITDAGLVHLKDLPKLDYLALSVPRMTNAGMAHIGDMPQLQLLRLEGTSQITDVGLVHLGRLTELQGLSLNLSGITDAGLVHIDGLSNLKSLDIAGSKVSPNAVRRQREKFPDRFVSPVLDTPSTK